MKISDKIYRYPCMGSRNDGLCRLRIFNNKAGKIVALITEIDENPSASITNSIESIVESLIKNYEVPSNTIFIEHYEMGGVSREVFELVTFDGENRPIWESLKRSKVSELVDCSMKEFETPTMSDLRLVNDIGKLRTEINPLLNLPNSHDIKRLKKKFEIEDGKISKLSIQELIDNGASEQDIQNLLKKDLSIFAEVYAHPTEDYICFSEFPVGDGYVDFVVLSGISRMDVILVEVKGAEFNIFNKGHYDKFNSKIESAMHQLRQRMRYITENRNEFRKKIHKIREAVESGSKIYNAFIGPSDHLEVDSNKDINVYTVVIGGRTENDLKESKKRHDRETESIRLDVESWDSWLRKIRRE